MLKHVRIRNFKSLHVSVDLDPITVLIGRSGTGKTNFVEAFRVLRRCLDPHKRNQLQNQRQSFGSLTASLPYQIEFDLLFSVRGIDGDFRYELRVPGSDRNQPTQLQFADEKLTLGSRVLFHQHTGKWLTEPALVTVPRADLHNPMLASLNGVPEVTSAYLFLSDGISCHDFPGDVLSPAQAGATPRSSGTSERGLEDSGENYLQVFNDIVRNLNVPSFRKEIVACLRRLNHSIRGVDPAMPGRDKIIVTHEFAGRTLPIGLEQESEGTRRFLVYLLALYQSPSKQTLFFEEPEKGIHPGALAVLAEQFKACPDASRGQIILTTHGPGLLDHFAPESIRVVEMDNLVTKIGPVASEQLEALREQLLQPGELLTVDPARMELASAMGA